MIRILKTLKNEEFLYSIVTKVVQMVGGLVFIKLLSSFLSKNDFGYYSLMMATIGLIGMVPFSALNQGVLRFTSDYKKKVDLLFSNVLIIYLFFISIYFLVIVFVPFFYHFSDEWKVLLSVLPLLVFTYILFNYLTWFENGLKNQKAFAIILFFDFVIKFFGILILKELNILDVKMVIYLVSFSTGFIFIFFANKFINVSLISFYKIKDILFEMLPYIYPIILWSGFVWAQGMVYRWYLGWFSSASDVASFSIMSSLSILPVTSITGIIGTYLLPRLFHQETSEQSSVFNKIAKTILIVLIIFSFMLVFILFFKVEIVTILTSKKYADDAWMLPYMFSAMMVYAAGNISSYVSLSRKETKDLLFANIVPGLLAIIVGYFLIRDHGMNGALVTFIMTYTLVGILNSYVVIRKNYALNKLANKAKQTL